MDSREHVRKPLLPEGFWGQEPKTQMRLVGGFGFGLLSCASRDRVCRPSQEKARAPCTSTGACPKP